MTGRGRSSAATEAIDKAGLGFEVPRGPQRAARLSMGSGFAGDSPGVIRNQQRFADETMLQQRK
jgi:hypothetical protein